MTFKRVRDNKQRELLIQSPDGTLFTVLLWTKLKQRFDILLDISLNDKDLFQILTNQINLFWPTM